MFGNKLLLNEASRFDPQMEPKNLQVSNQLFHDFVASKIVIASRLVEFPSITFLLFDHFVAHVGSPHLIFFSFFASPIHFFVAY